MEKIVEQGLLYDFYGELLTKHQKKVYEDVVMNDYSLAEMADEYGITRQGIHDLIKRCDRILTEYENKLHLIKRFEQINSCIGKIDSVISDETVSEKELRMQIKQIAAAITEEL